MHTLGFAGMPDFITPNSSSKASQFWIAARSLSALAFLGSAFVLPGTSSLWLTKPVLLATVLLVVGVVLVGVTWFPGRLPETLVPGVGLTPFKRRAEFAIIATLLASVAAYGWRYRRTRETVLPYYGTAFLILALSEAPFASYRSAYDIVNAVGHVDKVIAFALIYRGCFSTSVLSPYREVVEKERALRRVERELHAAAGYTRSLLEASLDPLVTISPEGRITDVNHATEQATGVGRGALVGTNFADYFTEPERAQDGYRRVLAEGLVRDYPLTMRHVSGRTTDVLYNASVYRNEGGALQGVYAAARDVTERRRAEAQIRRLNEGLERRVAERTAQLENAYAELEGFSYSVSHDLRAPLRAIDGFSRILMDEHRERLDAEGMRLLGVVRDNTVRMARLIDDILAFSRVGRVGMSPSEVDMTALCRPLADVRGAVARGRDVRVEVGELPPARGDSGMLRQVFANLIDNSLKFTRQREAAWIEVGGHVEGRECVYFVRDNGAGFDMQYVDKLFGVFQRLHSSDEFEGTGIGLAIVKRIVERHGGRVWGEGRVGEGATMHFTLPRGE